MEQIRLREEDADAKNVEIMDLHQQVENHSRTARLQQALIDKLRQENEDLKVYGQKLEHEFSSYRERGVAEV